MRDRITHHLTDGLIMGYAAGTLPEAFDLVVASHISMCDECRARLAAYDAVGGAVIDSTEGAELAEDSFASTLRLIEAEKAAEPPAPSWGGIAAGGVLPAPVQAYVGGDVDAVKWRRLGGGVFDSVIRTSDGEATARLLRIAPGKAVPDHGHEGSELTLVLQGAFSDAAGRFGPGDVEVATEEVEHTPIAEEGDVCICLAAMDHPLKFSKFLPRLAQKVMRI
ncbi:ChrR family anti-sigma-E factor [Histidinibacterium lentulum]|uniref:Transcriptional regulator n=1 Tax=Histidinibacterium lentulum TaxID=2480588 RepID=A0A3N2R6Z0_9RHOB|nr:ChrR family anti-sigma-E factor [Histidinibacterium lentulum]ROU03262.1 transcriptional regulator [Histidinibacterium lentulum]